THPSMLVRLRTFDPAVCTSARAASGACFARRSGRERRGIVLVLRDETQALGRPIRAHWTETRQGSILPAVVELRHFRGAELLLGFREQLCTHGRFDAFRPVLH